MRYVRYSEKESGISLTGLLIALAVSGVLMLMLAQAVESFMGVSATENAVSNTTARSARLENIVESMLHNAGFGFPGLTSCPSQTVIGNFDGQTTAEYPVSAAPETAAQYGASLPAPMDTLTITSGQSVDGSAVMARVINLSSPSAQVVSATTSANVQQGDGFVIELPGMACLLLSNTGVSVSSTGAVNWDFSNSSASNPPDGISSLLNYMSNNGIGAGGLSTNNFNNARILVTGNTTIKTLYVQGQTLMGQFIVTGANGPTTVTTPIMNNVLAMRVSLGTGSGGTIQNWMSASQWQAMSPASNPVIMAVRIGFILVSNSGSSQVKTPSSISLLGKTFPIPNADQGHVVSAFHVTLPVENSIWTQ